MIPQITLTIKEICELAKFVGISINEEKSVFHEDPEMLETEICISAEMTEGVKEAEFQQRYAWYDEYPEEGVFPL